MESVSERLDEDCYDAYTNDEEVAEMEEDENFDEEDDESDESIDEEYGLEINLILLMKNIVHFIKVFQMIGKMNLR